MAPRTDKDLPTGRGPQTQRTSRRIQGLSPSSELRPATSTQGATSEASNQIRLAPSSSTGSQSTKIPQNARTMETETEGEIPALEEQTAYPNHHDDPNPAPETATALEKEDKKKALREYGFEMLEAYKETCMIGQAQWLDFITAFGPHSVRSWTRPMLAKWADFLTKRDIFVASGRKMSRAEAIIELLYREEHISATKTDRTSHQKAQVAIIKEQKNGSQQDAGGQKTNKPLIMDFTQNGASMEKETRPHGRKLMSTPGGGGPGDDDDSDPEDSRSSDSWPERTRDVEEQMGGEKRAFNEREDGKENTHQGKPGLGRNGLMKAYIGKEVFKGVWEEDLDNCIKVYETLSRMCKVDKEEMLQSLPIMLSGDALNYFSSEVSGCESYDDAMDQLQKWYNSDEKRARILTVWQQMTLSEEMSRNPGESEVVVFRKFVSRLMSLQKELRPNYHSDDILRDRLLTALNIPSIQVTLRDRIPRTSQQAVNRVANQLSDKPRSAGSSLAMVSQEEDN